jgi:hypothetical protein
VIFYEESSAGGGGILQATAVRVQFATPAPRILAVTTSPRLVDQDGWLVLPKRPATSVRRHGQPVAPDARRGPPGLR